MDEVFFTKAYNLRHGDFDASGNIKINRVMELAEDAAQEHTELLGIGMSHLHRENASWVLLREKIVLDKAFREHSTVTVLTWHCGKAKHISQREFVISEGNTVLARISSQWGVIDIEKRSMILPRAFDGFSGFSENTALEGRLTGVKMPVSMQKAYSYTIGYLDIDMNNHINNTHYAELIQNALGEERIKEIQIDFHKEMLLGDTVNVFVFRENNEVFFEGQCGGEKMFCAKALTV